MPLRPLSAWERTCLLAAAWSFAVTQTVLYQLARHPFFLDDTGVVGGALWLFVLGFSFLPPLLLSGVVQLIGRCHATAGLWVFRTIFGTLMIVLLLQVLRAQSISLIVVACLAVTAATIVLSERVLLARQFLVAAGLGIVVFPVMFILGRDVRPLLMPPVSSLTHPGTETVGNPVPVVLMVFDEFSGATLWDKDRQIDANLFPNFARLASEAFWYRNATSVHAQTVRAVPSILTGLYPPADPNQDFNPDKPLFSVLMDQHGYDGFVLEPVTGLCKTPWLPLLSRRPETANWREFAWCAWLATVRQVVPIDIDSPDLLPQMPMVWYGLGVRVVDLKATRGLGRHPWQQGRDSQIEHFLSGLTPGVRPTLYFMHVILPHSPYHFDAQGREYTNSEVHWDFPRPGEIQQGGWSTDLMQDKWPDDPLFCAQAQLRYVWQAQWVDRYIGRVRERLIESDLYDKCLWVIVSDHGVSQRPGGRRRTMVPSNAVDILSVPLFIKPPGKRKGGVVDEPVETIDIFPTVLETLQIADGPPVDGQPLLGKPIQPRPSKRFIEPRGLQVIPGDYPKNIDRSALPLLAAEIPSRIRTLSDPLHLIGRPVSEIDSGPPSDLKASWLPGTLRGQGYGSGNTLYLAGRLTSAPPPRQPVTLALAFDGRIAEVTRTYLDEKEAGYFLFLSGGENHPRPVKKAEVLLVETKDGKPRLRPCPEMQLP